MSSVVISGDTSGAITLSAPAVSGTNTATLPAATGTVMVSGNQPAFSAYMNTATTLTTSTFTKLSFDVKDFDTASCYNTSTYRFTPNVAGYYAVTGTFRAFSTASTATSVIFSIYKNGSEYQRSGSNVTSAQGYSQLAGLVYCNGSTDYIELYGYQDSGSTKTTDNATNYKFTSVLVRAA
jgi:hypothetical protein